MKPIENKNYYELLEVSSHAGWGEIQMAYELARKTYQDDAMGSYSLFTAEEREAILNKVEEAYRVLSDPKKKEKYDQALALLSSDPPPPTEPIASELHEETSLSGDVTGEAIKTLREKKGISLEEISETTRINIDYLSAIENDNVDFLPAEVYVRSYLRQMAKMIRCSNDMVESYMRGYKSRLKSKRPMGLPSRVSR